MTIDAANTTLYASCDYRQSPVRTPFCRWHRYARFRPGHRRQKTRHRYATDSSMAICSPLTSHFTNLCRKVWIQIPIARLATVTALLHPAVSSLEAYQTPAR